MLQFTGDIEQILIVLHVVNITVSYNNRFNIALKVSLNKDGDSFSFRSDWESNIQGSTHLFAELS